MRKFLLFAATAMFVASANAQVLGSRAQHHALPQATKAKYDGRTEVTEGSLQSYKLQKFCYGAFPG